MMLFTTTWLQTIFTQFKGHLKKQEWIHEVTTDSRTSTVNALFVPLVGEYFDGHDFVHQAIDNGAIAILWDEKKALPSNIPNDIIVFFVADPLASLQTLAKHYRELIQPIVVGITGSNGKTTTKDLVTSIVKTTYKTHFTHGNLNNHIGLPLTILSMSRDTEVLVLEMGMNDFGEIELLSNIAQPDYAMIVNIGESHIEFLGSRVGIAQAKLEIITGLKSEGCLFIDGDEELLTKKYNHMTISCGFKPGNDLQIEHFTSKKKETTFQLSNGQTYTISLLGKHNVHNAAFAVALGERLNIPYDHVQKGLSRVVPTSMRMEFVTGKNGVSIINDAYNASPTSMKAAIEVVKNIKGFRKKILILGDILELGSHSTELHQQVAETITHPITAVFTYGKEAKIISHTVKTLSPDIDSIHFQAKNDLIKHLRYYLHEDVLLLFKASRGMQFETFIKALQH